MVLVGGTMHPMGDFLQQLFPAVPLEKVKTLSVDHVIPDCNILPLTVKSDLYIRLCMYACDMHITLTLLSVCVMHTHWMFLAACAIYGQDEVLGSELRALF